MSNDLMSIRAMCDAFDVTPRTLRFYEAKELLCPIREGQKRLFTRRDRARLKLILCGKRFGFTLEEMRQLLNLYDTPNGYRAQLTKAHDIATFRLQDMIQRRAELEATIDELRGYMDNAVSTVASIRARLKSEDDVLHAKSTAGLIHIEPSDRTAVRKFARL